VFCHQSIKVVTAIEAVQKALHNTYASMNIGQSIFNIIKEILMSIPLGIFIMGVTH
jgi:hypothetical protein